VSALRDLAPYLAVFATAAAVALLAVAVWLGRSLRRLKAGQAAVLGPHGRRDLVDHAGVLEEQVRNLRDAVEMLSGEVEAYRQDLDGSLGNMALVRFDAFRDTGGQQSAAIAILDNYRSGVVVSIIAARDVARLYVKHLDHGRADRELSPEEAEAVKRAVPHPLQPGELSGRPVPTLPRSLPPWRREEGDEEPAAVLEGQEQLDLESMSIESDRRPWRPQEGRRPPAAAVTVDELEAAAEDEAAAAPPAAARAGRSAPAAPGAEAAALADEGATPRRPPEDWLGGDDLDF
jgi:hypothetical protein